MRFVVIPGNGGCGVDTMNANWYGWFASQVEALGHTPVVPNYPDPHVCRASIWLPFLRDDVKIGEDCVLVGHSTGALAAMRILEGGPKVHGVVLVSCAHTDLGDEGERASEFFNQPWEFGRMRANADWIVQFHSPDDHLIPVEEGRFVAKGIEEGKGGDFVYRELEGKGHFFRPWNEIISEIEERVPRGS